MKQELWYFKFNTSKWLTGDIAFEDMATQGLFINICALYWHRNGKVSIEDLEKRFKVLKTDRTKPNGKRKKAVASSRFYSLFENYISVKNGYISIQFLDEQMKVRKSISKTNSKNGKLGGRPKVDRKKPNGKRTVSESKANQKRIKSQLELELELELKIKNKQKDFNLFFELYPKKVGRVKCETKWQHLTKTEIVEIFKTLPAFLKYKPFENYNHPNPETYLDQKRWQDVIPDSPKINDGVLRTSKPTPIQDT